MNASENLYAIFSPEIVLPGQAGVHVEGKSYMRGECRLMAAILQEAISTYYNALQKGLASGDEAQEIEAWIRGDPVVRLCGEDGRTLKYIYDRQADPNEWIYSFENICDILGLHPDWLRGRITRMKKQILEGKSPPQVRFASHNVGSRTQVRGKKLLGRRRRTT